MRVVRVVRVVSGLKWAVPMPRNESFMHGAWADVNTDKIHIMHVGSEKHLCVTITYMVTICYNVTITYVEIQPVVAACMRAVDVVDANASRASK